MAAIIGISPSHVWRTKLSKEREAKRCMPLMVSSCLVQTEIVPLTKLDLINHLASGCKPKSKWKIGTEHEKFGFEVKTLKPLNYCQIKSVLEGVASKFHWERVMEGGYIIGLKKSDGQSISLEPGGQLELSGAQLDNLHQTHAEVSSHLAQVNEIAKELDLGFIGMGFAPKWSHADMPHMPHNKFHILSKYFPLIGTSGLDVCFRTCTVQVNLDFSSERDMVKKMRVGLALQPLATSLFANSPFTAGVPNGYTSYRNHLYQSLDIKSKRTGNLPFVFHDGFGFEQYVEYALDIPMLYVYREDQCIPSSGLSFRDFLNGRLPNLPGELPTLNDWETHLGCVFPEVRLRRYLEMRGADSGPLEHLCALPAFWVGLLYDSVSLDMVYDYICDWSEEERATMMNLAPTTGLKTPFRGGRLSDVARDILRIAQKGMERRGSLEAGFLDPISKALDMGKSPAEQLLEMYKGKWQESVDPIFQELCY